MAAHPEGQAPWLSDDELDHHYRIHHWDVPAGSISEYDASARATIRDGQRFTYTDPGRGRPHVGYYDSETGLFTALSGDGRLILTHFRPEDGEQYIRDLPHSTYR
jgi:hypothetical protein